MLGLKLNRVSKRGHLCFVVFSAGWFSPYSTPWLPSASEAIPMTSSLIAKFMGPTWGPSGADRTQVGPMLAPWILLTGLVPVKQSGLAGLLHSHSWVFPDARRATLKNMSKWITWILKDLGPLYRHESTLIPTWISNYIHHEVCNEKTSMVAPLKFGNRYVIHILLGMWLLIHAGITVNPC